jgi:hypothetical protein
VVESPQSIFANNFFAVRKAGIAAIGNDTGGSLPRPAPTKFWDNNRYECSPSNVFYFAGWHTLGAMRSVFQVDFNTTLVTAEDVVTNVPVNFFEGTTKAMMPIAGRALIDSGASSSQLTGLENLLGPHLGSAPDVGAYELGLGEAWVGPRAFTDRLAYGVPSGWSVASLASLGGYADLGAPGSVSDGRLLLVSSSPRAFLVVSFEPAAGESRWTRYEDLLDGNAGDTMLVGPARFRQGLAGSIVRRGANANLLGCRVDDNGVLKILGGTASGDLGAVQNEMFTFLRSLYYSWTLSN